MKKLRLSDEWALIATCAGPFSFLTAVTNEWYGEKLTWNPETDEVVNASSWIMAFADCLTPAAGATSREARGAK